MVKKNILETATTYTLSDFQNYKLAESYKKLYQGTTLENQLRVNEKINKRIYNLSIKQLTQNFFTVWTEIINEMTELIYDNSKNKDFRNYMVILTKNQRIIYVGIMFIFLSVASYFIFATS